MQQPGMPPMQQPGMPPMQQPGPMGMPPMQQPGPMGMPPMQQLHAHAATWHAHASMEMAPMQVMPPMHQGPMAVVPPMGMHVPHDATWRSMGNPPARSSGHTSWDASTGGGGWRDNATATVQVSRWVVALEAPGVHRPRRRPQPANLACASRQVLLGRGGRRAAASTCQRACRRPRLPRQPARRWSAAGASGYCRVLEGCRVRVGDGASDRRRAYREWQARRLATAWRW